MDSGDQIYQRICYISCNVGSGVLLKLNIQDKLNYSEIPTVHQQIQSSVFSLNVLVESNTL